MQTISEMAFHRAQRGIFTREQAALWVGNRGAKLDGLLKRAVAGGEVWRIRKGLYCLSDRLSRSRIDPLDIAQRIHGPSYISLETALSHHGWIPEAVHAIASVSQGRTRLFDTPLGLYSYTRIPQRRFLAGVRRTSIEGGGAFFIATPLKALADLVYVQGQRWRGVSPVIESLRVEPGSLAGLDGEMFEEVIAAYKPGRVSRFLNGLRKDLNS